MQKFDNMTIRCSTLILTFLIATNACLLCQAEPVPVVANALGGTLARDHQSRSMYFEGKHRRTYLVYMDDEFNARITFYDHDSKSWAKPAVVDDCIAEVGWCKGLKDGHNVPNLWISKSGTIHIIYGSHGTPFKYARGKKPESIDGWELGKRISNFGTYPFFCELPDGQILMFYRYGPTGGYVNPFLAYQRTSDGGRTWSKLTKLAAMRKACKMNGFNALYDADTGRIHLNLALIPNGSWACFGCQLDPASDRLYSWDGKTYLGPMPSEDAFVKHCKVQGQTLQEIFLHDGVLYMLLRRDGEALSFARWDGKKLEKHDIPSEKTVGYNRGPIWTTDGETITFYAMRKEPSQKPPGWGGNLYAWTSTDGGKTWSDGKPLVLQKDLGINLLGVNRVMNYPGSGPFLFIAEATSRYPKDFKVTPKNHYDNPWRKNKKIYALDEQGRFISGGR